MATTFPLPASPTVGTVATLVSGTVVKWDGSRWAIQPTPFAPNTIIWKTVSDLAYTVTVPDALGGGIKTTGSSATTITIGENGSAPILINTTLLILQMGTGLVSVAGGTDVVFRKIAGSTLSSAGQYSMMSMTKVGLNEWVLNGGFA